MLLDKSTSGLWLQYQVGKQFVSVTHSCFLCGLCYSGVGLYQVIFYIDNNAIMMDLFEHYMLYVVCIYLAICIYH